MFPNPKNDPLAVLSAWVKAAKDRKDITEPAAMALATADARGRPSVRMVLLKGCDAEGLVFYTNFESRKGRELEANPRAALCFFWEKLGRQVRVEGRVKRVSAKEADAYFKSRARDSRIGAWASKQSRELKGGTKQLMAEVAKAALKFVAGEVPRPSHWGGYLLIPERIEFWEHGAARLHKRIEFTRKGKGWQARRLYP